METIKAEYKKQFNLTLTDEQAKVIQAKRQPKVKETIEIVRYWGGPKQTVTKINGFRI